MRSIISIRREAEGTRAVSGICQRRPKVSLVCTRFFPKMEDHFERDHMVAGDAGHYFLAGSLEKGDPESEGK